MTRPARAEIRARMTAAAAIAALCLLGAGLAVVPTALASQLHLEHSRVSLRLAAPGHRRVEHSTAHLPARLPGYYAYVQLVKSDGTLSPQSGPGHHLVLLRKDGKAQAVLTLGARYDTKTGRLRLTLTLDNVRIRNYKAKNAGVSAVVTVGWRS